MNLTKLFLNQDKLILFFLGISLLSIILNIIFFIINYVNLPPRVPLFYSLPWGDNWLVALPQFLILASIALLFLVLNFFMIWYLHSSQLIIKRLIAVSTAFISLLFLITGVKIVLIFV